MGSRYTHIIHKYSAILLIVMCLIEIKTVNGKPSANDRQDYENGNLRVKQKTGRGGPEGNMASVKRTMKIMSECSNNFMRTNGRRIRADGTLRNATLFTMTTLNKHIITLQGSNNNLICFNRRGRLIQKKWTKRRELNDRYCHFKQIIKSKYRYFVSAQSKRWRMGFGKNGNRLTRFDKKRLWNRWFAKMKKVRQLKKQYGKSSAIYIQKKTKYRKWTKKHNMCFGWKSFRFQILITKNKEPGPEFNHENFTVKTNGR